VGVGSEYCLAELLPVGEESGSVYDKTEGARGDGRLFASRDRSEKLGETARFISKEMTETITLGENCNLTKEN